MEDYINRKEIRKHLFDRLIETAINNTGYLSDASLVYQDAAERIRLWIDEIPAAGEVERKTAKWQKLPIAHYLGGFYCSECLCSSPLDFSFCPNCGASMEN